MTRTYLTRKPMYKYTDIPVGGERFWEAPPNKARSIGACARYWGKKMGIKMVAKLVDGGVWVFNMGVSGDA